MSDAYDVQNGNFGGPPTDPTIPISDDNPLPGWAFVQTVGTGTIAGWWIADTTLASFGKFRFIGTAMANLDSAYLEGKVAVVANASGTQAVDVWVSLLDWSVSFPDFDASVELQFLKDDGTTTGGATLESLDISAATPGVGDAPNENTFTRAVVVPADAAAARIRLIVTAGAGPTAATVDIGSVRMPTFGPAMHFPDAHDSTKVVGRIWQEDGYLDASAGDSPHVLQTQVFRTISGYIDQQEGAAPGTPASGYGRAYVKADGLWYSKDDAGVETLMSSGAGGGGAPTTVNYLVGTADAGLSAEIVVGTTPNGELGGTWGAITVDANHGGTHAIGQGGTGSTTAAAAVDALGGAASTGTGGLVRKTSAALVTPDLGTPSALVGTNITGTAAGLTVGAVSAGAVTLAMMANLAQDLFIGRTTASTGVPQTATITAAARTVLDDTTVGAMVDTLGGAAAVGTGGLARATSPVFVTPLLGTPTSGVATNLTGTAAGLTAGNVTTNANLTGEVTSVGNAATVVGATGTFTPTFDFVTHGNLNIVYSVQTGRYIKLGNRVWYFISITTSTFTHTTAAGNATIGGLPFTAANVATNNVPGAGSCAGWTKALYTAVNPIVVLNTTTALLSAMGSGQALLNLTTAEFPTGGTLQLRLSGFYET